LALTGTVKSVFKVRYPLVEVEVEWRRSCFGLEEPDWCSLIGTSDDPETLGLCSS
jgi:hypothetical protein